MLLFKDYQTSKKSLTVTCVVISVTITWALILIEAWHRCNGEASETGAIWASVSFSGVFVGVLWNKRIRANKDGIAVDGDCKTDEVS